LNHPIRFVYVVGVVVAIDDISVRYTVLTLDDGSGATIEAKIVRRVPGMGNNVETPSNTVVDNLNVITKLGSEFNITVGGQVLDIGTVVKVKGTVSEFRDFKQLELKRIWIVPTTNEEVRAWQETAAYKQKILSKPWRLTSSEHNKIKNDIKAERRKEREYERLKEEHEARKKEQKKARAEYLAQKEARYEARRRKEENIMNAGALI